MTTADHTLHEVGHAAARPAAIRVPAERDWRQAGPLVAVAVLMGLLGVDGMLNSAFRVIAVVRPDLDQGWLAPTIPIGIDMGIGVFTAYDLLLVARGHRVRWLRLVSWALTGVTVGLNTAGETTRVGLLTHGTLPMLWVCAVEATAHTIRVWSRPARPARERIRPARWILAPVSTPRMWRRMVLDDIDLTEALRAERERITWWQRRRGHEAGQGPADVVERVTDVLIGAGVDPAGVERVGQALDAALTGTVVSDADAGEVVEFHRRPARRVPRRSGGATAPVDADVSGLDDDAWSLWVAEVLDGLAPGLVTTAEEVADGMVREGVPLTKGRLTPRLRARASAGSAAIGRLLRYLKAREAREARGRVDGRVLEGSVQ